MSFTAQESITERGVEALWDAPRSSFDSDSSEQAAIEAARNGDDDARLALLRAYIPLLRSVLAKYLPAGLVDNDDLRQQAVVGFFEAVRAFDPAKGHRRLTALVYRQVLHALSDQRALTFALKVPEPERLAYSRAFRAAGGDVDQAAELAPEHGITTETFWLVYAALEAHEFNVNDHDVASDEPENFTNLLVETAIANTDLDARERLALTAYYGLRGEAATDGEIADLLGVHRTSALRIRESGLAKLRANLSAADEG